MKTVKSYTANEAVQSDHGEFVQFVLKSDYDEVATQFKKSAAVIGRLIGEKARLETALALWCPQCDMKLLERTSLDCGHGQIVQTGCEHCERKLGRTDVELQPISDHCEHEWSAVRRGFHQCLKNCGAYMDALNGRVLTASTLLAADRCKNMTHKRYGLKECIECVPPLGLCSDCPPVGYPTNKTRCDTCPRLDPYPELP